MHRGAHQRFQPVGLNLRCQKPVDQYHRTINAGMKILLPKTEQQAREPPAAPPLSNHQCLPAQEAGDPWLARRACRAAAHHTARANTNRAREKRKGKSKHADELGQLHRLPCVLRSQLPAVQGPGAGAMCNATPSSSEFEELDSGRANRRAHRKHLSSYLPRNQSKQTQDSTCNAVPPKTEAPTQWPRVLQPGVHARDRSERQNGYYKYNRSLTSDRDPDTERPPHRTRWCRPPSNNFDSRLTRKLASCNNRLVPACS